MSTAKPAGPASATEIIPGTATTATVLTPSGNDTLARLADVIDSRRKGDPDKSYVARLFDKGPDAIMKKVGEEATEVVMAGKDADPRKIVYEVADLWFHSMLMLSWFGLRPSDVLDELERREGLSGLEEFAARKAVLREQNEQSSSPSSPDTNAGVKP